MLNILYQISPLRKAGVGQKNPRECLWCVCLAAHSDTSWRGSSVHFPKWTVFSGEGITIFSNRAPNNYQILQEHLDMGISQWFPSAQYFPVQTRQSCCGQQGGGMLIMDLPGVLLSSHCCIQNVMPFQPVNGDLLVWNMFTTNKNNWEALQTLRKVYPVCKQCWLQLWCDLGLFAESHNNFMSSAVAPLCFRSLGKVISLLLSF